MDDKELYEKRVRMCLLRWSGYSLSNEDVEYIISKSNFKETLDKEHNILDIPPQRTASVILYTAALDLKTRFVRSEH